jgi:aspartate aminotransferase-like enzyme
MRAVTFKPLTTAEELKQVHQLNHRTFAEELGQYELQANGELIDRFHPCNCYFVAKSDEAVVGMISINSTAPFSIEKRLTDAEGMLARFRDPSEVRLLAVSREARNGIVVAGLFWQVYAEARRRGRSHLLISGIEDRAEMYRSLGFRELGVAVPSGAVRYIPMAMDLNDADVEQKARRFSAWWQRRDCERVSLLPGPVQISRTVRAAFEQAPVSHRASSMVETYGEVRRMLSELAGGMQVAVMTGSGTLANDAVAACLRARFVDRRGLVLTNGEFGERLVRQAQAAGLQFETMRWHWGERWNFAAIEGRLERGADWVWCVHLETSTGQLNDLWRLNRLCEEHGVAVAADCVSSLGAVPLEDCRLALASGVSGKALGSYAGVAMVFADERTLEETPFDRVPATFDLAQNVRQRAPMFTVASPQLRALRKALEENYGDARSRAKRYAHYCALGTWVRAALRERGLEPLVDDETAAPVICTFELADVEIARRCSDAGFQIAHESGYLVERGWGQISVMGDLTRKSVEGVFAAL